MERDTVEMLVLPNFRVNHEDMCNLAPTWSSPLGMFILRATFCSFLGSRAESKNQHPYFPK